MKKISLFILLLLSLAAGAQKRYTFIQGGYNASIHSFDALNAVITRYNETRTGVNGSAKLTKQMPFFHLTSGYTFAIGNLNSETGLIYGVRLITRAASGQAQGVDANGQTASRNIKIYAHSFNTDLGYTFINSGPMDVAIGASMDLVTHGLSSSLNNGPYLEADISPANLNVGISPFTQVHLTVGKIGLFGRVWYQFNVLKNDYQEVNELINPATAYNDEFVEGRNFESTPNNFGIEVGAMILFGKKKMNSSKLIRGKDTKKN